MRTPSLAERPAHQALGIGAEEFDGLLGRGRGGEGAAQFLGSGGILGVRQETTLYGIPSCHAFRLLLGCFDSGRERVVPRAEYDCFENRGNAVDSRVFSAFLRRENRPAC